MAIRGDDLIMVIILHTPYRTEVTPVSLFLVESNHAREIPQAGSHRLCEPTVQMNDVKFVTNEFELRTKCKSKYPRGTLCMIYLRNFDVLLPLYGMSTSRHKYDLDMQTPA